jgi:hypothetical protein
MEDKMENEIYIYRCLKFRQQKFAVNYLSAAQIKKFTDKVGSKKINYDDCRYFWPIYVECSAKQTKYAASKVLFTDIKDLSPYHPKFLSSFISAASSFCDENYFIEIMNRIFSSALTLKYEINNSILYYPGFIVLEQKLFDIYFTKWKIKKHRFTDLISSAIRSANYHNILKVGEKFGFTSKQLYKYISDMQTRLIPYPISVGELISIMESLRSI